MKVSMQGILNRLNKQHANKLTTRTVSFPRTAFIFSCITAKESYTVYLRPMLKNFNCFSPSWATKNQAVSLELGASQLLRYSCTVQLSVGQSFDLLSACGQGSSESRVKSAYRRERGNRASIANAKLR